MTNETAYVNYAAVTSADDPSHVIIKSQHQSLSSTIVIVQCGRGWPQDHQLPMNFLATQPFYFQKYKRILWGRSYTLTPVQRQLTTLLHNFLTNDGLFDYFEPYQNMLNPNRTLAPMSTIKLLLRPSPAPLVHPRIPPYPLESPMDIVQRQYDDNDFDVFSDADHVNFLAAELFFTKITPVAIRYEAEIHFKLLLTKAPVASVFDPNPLLFAVFVLRELTARHIMLYKDIFAYLFGESYVRTQLLSVIIT